MRANSDDAMRCITGPELARLEEEVNSATGPVHSSVAALKRMFTKPTSKSTEQLVETTKITMMAGLRHCSEKADRHVTRKTRGHSPLVRPDRRFTPDPPEHLGDVPVAILRHKQDVLFFQLPHRDAPAELRVARPREDE